MQKLRSDDSFELFWTNINSKTAKLEIGPLEIPHKRRGLVRLFYENAEPEFPTEVKSHYR